MPAKYHPIVPTVWGAQSAGSPEIRNLNPDSFKLLMYIWSAPGRVSEGLFSLPILYAASDTGMTEREVRAAIVTLVETGWIKYDHGVEVCLDLNALKMMPKPYKIGKSKETGEPTPDSRIPGAIRQLKQLPETPLRDAFLDLADRYSPVLAAAIRDEVEAPTRPPQGCHKGVELGVRARSSQLGVGVRRDQGSKGHTGDKDDCPCDVCSKLRSGHWAKAGDGS